MSRVRIAYLLSAAMVALLLVAACGDDSSSTGPGDTAPGSAGTGTASSGGGGPALSECVDHENPGMSMTVELFPVLDRSPQVLPAGIGITDDCIRPLHTHTQFVLSIEYPEEREFTLRDFIEVWGEEGPYWEKDVDNMSVNGQAYCSSAAHTPDCAEEDPLGVVLEDGMRIAVDFNSE